MNKLVIIGKVRGTKGLNGYLKVFSEVVLKSGNKIVLKREIRKDLFSLEDVIHEYNNKYLIKLNCIEKIEEAEDFIHADLMILDKDLIKSSEEATSSEIIGMKIVDKTLGFLGEVNEVIKSPGNTLLSFIYKGKEILVPNVEEFVLLFNRDKRIIETDLKEVEQFES